MLSELGKELEKDLFLSEKSLIFSDITNNLVLDVKFFSENIDVTDFSEIKSKIKERF